MGLIRKWINRILGSSVQKSLLTAMGVTPAISAEMMNKIIEWDECYSGLSGWQTKYVKSLRLEKSICREFSNIVLNEMEYEIGNDKLNKVFKKGIKDLPKALQRGLATGAFIIKPLDSDHIQILGQNEFIPVAYDSDGRLTEVIFPEFKKIDKRFYTRLEYHALQGDKLIIRNKAFVSSDENSIGRECSLDIIPAWSNIAEETIYPTDRVVFGYYSNPIDNDIDGSFVGMSVFASALNLIHDADEQKARLNWEFESGERIVHVGARALKKAAESEYEGLPKLNGRLYKGLDLEVDNGELYKEYSPLFRDENIINGLEEIKREIEFNVGLAYGDLSNPQAVEKTAEEVMTSKQRKYNMVTAIQEQLERCLDDLLYAIAFYNDMTRFNAELNISFKDSILTDEKAERAQDMADIAAGLMNPIEYRVKWYGETEDEAKKHLPKMAEVIE